MVGMNAVKFGSFGRVDGNEKDVDVVVAGRVVGTLTRLVQSKSVGVQGKVYTVEGYTWEPFSGPVEDAAPAQFGDLNTIKGAIRKALGGLTADQLAEYRTA